MVKEKTSIAVDKEVHNDLMLFKIQSNAKDLNEVLRKAIKLLRKEK